MTDRKGLADEFATISATIMNATAQGCGSSHRVTAESPVVLSSVELLMAAALRQEPSVDEVARAIAANIDADIVAGGNIQLSGFKQAAQAIASLYRDKP